MKKISPEQKNTGSVIIAGVFIFFILWMGVYAPLRKSLGELKNELADVQSQIHEIENGIVGGAEMGDRIVRMRERYQKIDAKFPSKEEEALRGIMDLAKQFDMEIISIRPQLKVDFLDEHSQKVMIDGKTCQKFLVSIEMKGAYEDLIKYIHALRESLLAFVTIEGVKIRGRSSMAMSLEIELDLNLYLLL